MAAPVFWLDGEFISSDSISLSPVNHSLSYASSVHEGMRSYDGIVFKCEEHLLRLRNSASIFRHEIAYNIDTLSSVCSQVVSSNKLRNAYLKALVFYDGSDVSFMGRGCQSKVLIFALPFPSKDELLSFRLTIANWRRPPADCHPYQAKTSSTYALSFLSFRDKEDGFDDVLFLSSTDTVCESSGSNIFFIKNRQLVTPTTEMALAGITRRFIIDELAEQLGLMVVERDISMSELAAFDSAFLCGTAMEIVEVSRIDDIVYKKNSVVELLFAEYKKRVSKSAL